MDGIKITKKGLQAFIKHKIATDDRWALRALVVVYNSQEDDEKLFGSAKKQNGVGFGKIDASIMCVIAERYKRGYGLSPKDMNTVHRRMQKYWRQILDKSDKAKLESQYRKYIIEQEQIIEGINFLY